jgi:hypothetical protein
MAASRTSTETISQLDGPPSNGNSFSIGYFDALPTPSSTYLSSYLSRRSSDVETASTNSLRLHLTFAQSLFDSSYASQLAFRQLPSPTVEYTISSFFNVSPSIRFEVPLRRIEHDFARSDLLERRIRLDSWCRSRSRLFRRSCFPLSSIFERTFARFDHRWSWRRKPLAFPRIETDLTPC